MNSYKFNISSTSSSSSDDSEEERRDMENKEVDDMIDNVTHTYLPFLVSAVTPRMRPGGRTQPRADRGREEGHLRLYNDYFAENPVYSTIRQLAYGCASDACDEYIRISDSTTRLSLQRFVDGVINQFSNVYLRRPNEADLSRLLRIGEERGFPGMIGSIDCMHWEWKNCPTAWRGQYQGRAGVATLVLEAVADRDLCIWHSFFGMSGSCNDLNVLHRSPVFQDVLEGRAPAVNFVVNDHQYNKGYYLTVKSIMSPQSHKDKLFARHQEAARKDVERAFGVLQARFAIIRMPSLAWDVDMLHKIMLACIIMHIMIVEDERETYQNYMDPAEFDVGGSRHRSAQRNNEEQEGRFEYHNERIVDINTYLQHKAEIEDQQTHLSLKNDLIEHIWAKFGRNGN
ncbi:uncharacterized protein LOC125492722 [Beta vulgaris subsp. vulgaris]|uniref:uncharacterized protein LOC125492722 n=1 Tax=Beta vulgaris subsp. vulgaris TaxID=3555 RepID=UPI0020374BE1|nr:uncharacterized protein LOC125492722 [Beta vulgaris subsp. vulgaris]